MKKYIVRDGDTMWTISKETGVRLNLLMAANPQVTDPNRLRPGNVIVIPELYKKTAAKPSGEPSRPPTEPAPAGAVPPYFGFVWPHVVKAGETWESIAAGYNASVAQLKELNPESTRGAGARGASHLRSRCHITGDACSRLRHTSHAFAYGSAVWGTRPVST